MSHVCKIQFQSHYGAIATLSPLDARRPRTRFNPTMVRLRLLYERQRAHAWRCFNPTMVRLRRGSLAQWGQKLSRFQSHYGAIATAGRQANSWMMQMFQSHYGAIATQKWTCTSAFAFWFQSHYGAIATRQLSELDIAFSFVSIPLWCDCDFLMRWPANSSASVSIPLWCDCDHIRACAPPPLHPRFQSHYGAIATIGQRQQHWCRGQFQSHYGAIATL